MHKKQKIIGKIHEWIAINIPSGYNKNVQVFLIFDETLNIMASGELDPIFASHFKHAYEISDEIKSELQKRYDTEKDRCSCGGSIKVETVYSGGTIAGGDYGTCEKRCDKCHIIYDTWNY